MSSNNHSVYDSTRRTLRVYLGVLLGIAFILGALHFFFADLKVGGVSWFNLDKERNIPTWFSGTLLFLFGCSAMVAYYWEQKRNAEGPACFRLPILWLGIGLAGLLMSLDEITILHENLFWRETRRVSAQFSDSWMYVTQWQILFAPAIILVLGYFVLFFSNRFRVSLGARRSAFAGIGCWLLALLVEGVRGTFKQIGAGWYSFQVLTEEVLEMIGAILLLAAIIFYTIDIALDFTPERRNRLGYVSRFLTRQAAMALAVTFLALSVSGGTIYVFAQKQASSGAPVPRLVRQALESQPDPNGKITKLEPSIFEVSADEIWFENVQSETPLAMTDAETLLHAVAGSLSQGKGSVENGEWRMENGEWRMEDGKWRVESGEWNPIFHLSPSILHPPSSPFHPPSSILQADVSPRIVFLSVSDGTSHAQVAMGTGQGLRQALEQAIGHIPRAVSETDHPLWVKLDIVQRVHPVEEVHPDTHLNFERSLEGIAFERPLGIAFLPEELVAHTLVDSDAEIRSKNINRYLHLRHPELGQHQIFTTPGPLRIHRFTTASFFYDGGEVVSLYRGHRITGKVSRDILLEAARQGGDYLSRSVDPDGRFVYSYLPKTNEQKSKYNIIRHAGTVYSMLELYGTTGDEELLEAAERAIEYLLEFVKPYGIEKTDVAVVVSKDKIKLGAVALAAVALTEHVEVTQDQRYMPILRQLGRYIQQAQLEDGQFIHQRSYPEGERLDFVSQYYPGEALLALVRLYALDQQDGWLDTAEKGAYYLINVRDKGLSADELIHDHWLLYALNELYRYRPDPSYLSHALRIAQTISQSQNRAPAFADYLGSYYDPPRSTPTATRTEGLMAAYQLARDFGYEEEARSILETMHLNVAFQLQTQFRPESVLYLEDPQRSLGGFHRSLTNFEIRIDYVQHNISSLLGVSQILYERGIDWVP